ncbi:MAG: hypothetical protein HUU38_01785 [Anaerolineales bacterium]|nr:hypothetical protein [Anaerolineales bacterium]
MAFLAKHKEIRLWVGFILIALFYFVLRWGYLPAGAYWSPDNGYRRLQADAIRLGAEGVSFDLPYPGKDIDPAFAYVPIEGHFYFVRAGELHLAQWPLMPFLSRLLIALFGDRGAEIIPMLSGLLCVWLSGKLIHRGDFGGAWGGMILAGLLTPILIYSLVFWEHSVAAMLGIAVVFLLAEEDPFTLPRRVFLVSGGLAGLAGGVRKEMLLFAAAVALVLVIRGWHAPPPERRDVWGKILSWAFACAMLIASYGVTSYLKSGQLVPPEFRISVTPEYGPASYLVTQGWAGIANFIFDEKYGLLGSGLLLAVFAYAWAGYNPTPQREAIQVGLMITILVGNFQFLLGYSPVGDGIHGILTVSPFLILGLNREAWSTRLGQNLLGMALFFLTLSILSLGLMTKRGANQAELEWGARFMLVFFPLMIPLAVKGLSAILQRTANAKSRLSQWMARLHFATVFLLIGFSAILHGLGLLNILISVNNNLLLEKSLLALPETHVLTEVWWVAAQAPETYWNKQLFYNAGKPWDAWWQQARAQGITQVAYISLTELDEARLAALAPPGATLHLINSEWVSGRVFVTRLELTEEALK